MSMELKTTMVRFTVPKKQMTKRTDNSVMFDIPGDKVWIPVKKCIIKSTEDPNFNEVVMPRWVFLKTNLPLYFKAEEFTHVEQVKY